MKLLQLGVSSLVLGITIGLLYFWIYKDNSPYASSCEIYMRNGVFTERDLAACGHDAKIATNYSKRYAKLIATQKMENFNKEAEALNNSTRNVNKSAFREIHESEEIPLVIGSIGADFDKRKIFLVDIEFDWPSPNDDPPEWNVSGTRSTVNKFESFWAGGLTDLSLRAFADICNESPYGMASGDCSGYLYLEKSNNSGVTRLAIVAADLQIKKGEELEQEVEKRELSYLSGKPQFSPLQTDPVDDGRDDLNHGL